MVEKYLRITFRDINIIFLSNILASMTVHSKQKLFVSVKRTETRFYTDRPTQENNYDCRQAHKHTHKKQHEHV